MSYGCKCVAQPQAVKENDLGLVERLVAGGERVTNKDDVGQVGGGGGEADGDVANLLVQSNERSPQSLAHWAMAKDSKCGDKLLCYLLDQVLYPALAPLPSPRLTPDLAIILSLV